MNTLLDNEIDQCAVAIVGRNWTVALCHLECALQISPNDLRAAFLQGKLQLSMQQHEKAHSTFSRLLSQLPNSVIVRSALIDCQMSIGQEVEAQLALDRLLSEHPSHPIVLAAAANTHELLAAFSTARFYYGKLLDISPNHDMRTLASKSLLRHEDWQRGWELHESRRLDGSVSFGPFAVPPWNGLEEHPKNLNSNTRSILIVAEQGIGDCLQFLRFLPLLEPYFDSINFLCHRQIQPLLKASKKLSLWQIEDPPSFELTKSLNHHNIGCWAPLMSLPYLLREHVPTDPQKSFQVLVRDESKSRIAFSEQTERLRIGYCYTVNPLSETEIRPQTRRAVSKHRILQLVNEIVQAILGEGKNSRFAKLIEGFLVPALQKTRQPPEYFDLTIGSERFRPNNFLETCQILNSLDLVISVDTSIVHACGIMGKPCIVITPKSSDWRWGETSFVSSWYSSVRILRYPW